TNTVAGTATIPPYPTGVVVTPDGRRVLMDSVSSARLTIADLATAKLLPPIPLIVDIHPGGFGRIAVTGDGRRAYVTKQAKEYLAIVDLEARETTEWMLDMRPSDVTLSPDGKVLYLTGCKEFCTTGTVEMADPASGRTLGDLAVGPSPYRFALSPNGSRGYTT